MSHADTMIQLQTLIAGCSTLLESRLKATIESNSAKSFRFVCSVSHSICAPFCAYLLNTTQIYLLMLFCTQNNIRFALLQTWSTFKQQWANTAPLIFEMPQIYRLSIHNQALFAGIMSDMGRRKLRVLFWAFLLWRSYLDQFASWRQSPCMLVNASPARPNKRRNSCRWQVIYEYRASIV